MPNSDGFPRPFERRPGAGWLGRPLWKSSQIWSWRKSGPRKQVAVLERICFWLPTPRNCVETVILDAGSRDLLMPFTLFFFKMIFTKLPQVLQKWGPQQVSGKNCILSPSKRNSFVDLEWPKIESGKLPTCFWKVFEEPLEKRVTSRKLDTTVFGLGGKIYSKRIWEEKTVQSLQSSGPSMRFWMVDGNWQFSPSPHSEERKVYESWLPRSVCLIMCVCVCARVSFWSCVSPFRVCSYSCLVLCVCGSSKSPAFVAQSVLLW